MSDLDLRKLAIKSLILKAAYVNIGIYPQAIRGGPSAYETRSERQEGWNECAFAQTDRARTAENYLDSLPAEHRELVENLLLSGDLSLSISSAGAALEVFCSDLFYWGCADAEPIALDEIAGYQECVALLPEHGSALWVCRKRQMRPQAAAYEVMIPEESWALFDAAGPVRTDAEGKR